MRVVALLHQKGGTGKSTLAIGLATSLAASAVPSSQVSVETPATQARVLLLDADYQGTSSEWGNRYAGDFGIEVRSQVQPIVHRDAARFAARTDWLVIDGPPGLSEMTQSVLATGGRILVPLRPSLPDLWALPWFAALVGKSRREGATFKPLLVINQYRGEELAPFLAEAARWDLPMHPEPIPDDPAFARLFLGEPLPRELRERLLRLVGENSPV
jgi:chromosome partitioning protein